MKDNIRSILEETLTLLHADRLPEWVIARLASDFAVKANTRLRKLAAREVTNRKIARLFAAGRECEEGSRGETRVSPLGEQGPANGVSQGL